MKLRNLALILTIATLLPTFAYACDNTDAVRANFDRVLNHESAAGPISMSASQPDADVLEAINIALRTETDPVMASYLRDFYHEPVTFEAVLVNREADQLDEIFSVLPLYC